MHSTMLLTLACLNVYFVKTGSLKPCTKPVFGIFFKNLFTNIFLLLACQASTTLVRFKSIPFRVNENEAKYFLFVFTCPH